MRFKKPILYLLAIGLLLAACAPGVSNDGLVNASTSTPESLETTVPEVPVEFVATETPIPPTDQSGADFSPAAVAAQKMLAERLKIDAVNIMLLSIEEVQWPDGCLGVARPDEMCTQAIVDGYRIIFESGGKNYEFHTNMDGSQVREVMAPEPKDGGNLITGAAVTKARQFLALELGTEYSMIKLQSAKPMDWPDSCLGAAKAGQVCAQVITSGYQFIFTAGGKTYEVRTDNEGGIVVLVENSTSTISGTVLVLERTENETCSRLEVGEMANYGLCGGSLEQADLEPVRIDEIYELNQAYAPFTAETEAGKVEFQGKGKQVATEAEQRSIAEWAWMVLQETQSGQSDNTFGMVISWHREGGIVGFCDDLKIYASGWAYAENCRLSGGDEPRFYRLTAEELDQLFTWADGLPSFEENQEDPAGAADAMAVSLSMNGTGKGAAAAEEKQAILDFALNIFNATVN